MLQEFEESEAWGAFEVFESNSLSIFEVAIPGSFHYVAMNTELDEVLWVLRDSTLTPLDSGFIAISDGNSAVLLDSEFQLVLRHSGPEQFCYSKGFHYCGDRKWIIQNLVGETIIIELH